MDYLIDHDAKIIVIACNTGTTMCIDKLREKYKDIIFVGTVPAIKVAYDKGSKDTIILSTPNTMKSERVNELIKDYHRDDQNIINISGDNLANLIELEKKEEYMDLLHNKLDGYKDIADYLVLGCTHYSIIKNDIQEVLPNTTLVDGSYGVAKEVKRQLENNDLINPKEIEGSLDIVNSKNNDLIDRSYKILMKI